MPGTDSLVTVVSGLPRSGTSMMMQVLEAGGLPPLTDRTRAADRDNPKGYYELEVVKKTRNDSSWLAEAKGKAVKIIYLLLYDLPAGHTYHVIFMRRRMEEVLASQKSMLERQKKEGSSLPPEKLARVYEEQIRKVDAWLADQPDFHVLDVDYNQMVADPAPRVEQINEFLGGSLDTQAMVRAIDPDLYRQRNLNHRA